MVKWQAPVDLDDARMLGTVLILAALVIFAAGVLGLAVRVGVWAFGGSW